jgi:hypothetical protein
MFNPNTLLLLAALAAPLDTPTRVPTANDSALASVVAPLIQPGNHLRVRTGFGVTEGVCGPVGPAGLQLRHEAADIWSEPRVQPLTWSEIVRIDLRTRQPATGAKVGAVFGALLGIATMMSAGAYASAYGDSGLGGGTILIGGLAGGLVGGLIGGLVDAAAPAWKTIYERR